MTETHLELRSNRMLEKTAQWEASQFVRFAEH